MFQRVMVAVAGVPFLVAVLAAAPDWATLLLVAGMCALGCYELLRAVAGEQWEKLAYAVAAAALAPVWLFFLGGSSFPVYGMFVVLALFWAAIRRYGREDAIPFAHLTAALFAALVFPLMLSSLLLLRLAEAGRALVFVPLFIAFGSDTMALFSGLLFGKHKLAPRVSPKKTVEGAVGGLAGSVAFLALYKGILALLASYGRGTALALDWGTVAALGLFGGAVSEIGDLSFSVIKREFGVKDYGKLLPGHGGILDRFDSVTFVAPFVWFALGNMG